MSVQRKKGSPFYYYDFQVGGERFSGSTGKTDKGKARRFEIALKDEKKAEAKARQSLMAVTGGVRMKLPEEITIGAAVDRYFNEMVDGKINEAETETQLARLVTYFGQATKLHDIDSDRISGFVGWRKIQTARRKKDRVSPATVNRDTELLRRVISRARKTWKRRAADDIEWSDLLLPEPEGRVRELSLAEETGLVAVIDAMRPELLAPFLFSMLTGLRQAAVVGLTWKQVDMAGRSITVRLKSRLPGGRTLTVPLNSPALAILGAQKDHHDTAVFTYACKLKRGQRAAGTRQPVTASWLGNVWREALTEAKVTNFRWHDLRHTAATRLLRVSNLAVVKEMLGHKDIQSTMRYAHIEVEDVRRAVDAVGQRFDDRFHQISTSEAVDESNQLKKKA